MSSQNAVATPLLRIIIGIEQAWNSSLYISCRSACVQTWSIVQPRWFRQISFTCVLRSCPQSSPNCSFCWVISLQKCPLRFVLFFLSTITCYESLQKIQKKSPQFSIFYKDVPFDSETLGYYFTGYGSILIQIALH